MTIHLVTMALDIGRRFRHTTPMTIQYYYVNLLRLIELGLPIHVFAEKSTLKGIAGPANMRPHHFSVDDIRAQSWSAAASKLWASPDWQERFPWMKSCNAPELLCEFYTQLTAMKLDMLAEVAAIVDPETLLVWCDAHDSVMHYKAENFAAFEAHVSDRIALHWTPYNWENEELHGMRWSTFEPLACPKEARPQMHLMAGVMVGRAKTFTAFFPEYKATRQALFEHDLGTEQSILTAMYFRSPGKWFNPVKYPKLFQVIQR
jgi:hypothetical protein